MRLEKIDFRIKNINIFWQIILYFQEVFSLHIYIVTFYIKLIKAICNYIVIESLSLVYTRFDYDYSEYINAFELYKRPEWNDREKFTDLHID